jgi:hypothetical protein
MKELLLECDDFTGAVECTETHTLEDVRGLLAEEFDDDMLPAAYYFTCNGIRLSSKQEARKRAWDVVDQKQQIRIVDKKRELPAEESAPFAVEEQEESPSD